MYWNAAIKRLIKSIRWMNDIVIVLIVFSIQITNSTNQLNGVSQYSSIDASIYINNSKQLSQFPRWLFSIIEFDCVKQKKKNILITILFGVRHHKNYIPSSFDYILDFCACRCLFAHGRLLKWASRSRRSARNNRASDNLYFYCLLFHTLRSNKQYHHHRCEEASSKDEEDRTYFHFDCVRYR